MLNIIVYSLYGLQQALIAGIYLLSLVSVPCSLSAPAHHKMARDVSYPKWTMPCGPSISNDNPMHDVHPVSEAEILTQIVSQADIALNNAVKFKEDFANQIFKMSSQELHENWKTRSYDWLPKLHKNLNETLPQSHLDSLTLDESLISVYNHLQKIAVGLEQVVKDQDQNSQFLHSFNQSEHNLLSVLCEIHTAIFERNLTDKMKSNVSRDIMPDALRTVDGNTTARNIRDWIIYRDYMNALEYVIQVFDYFKTN